VGGERTVEDDLEEDEMEEAEKKLAMVAKEKN
jgi:hypothetical protein